MNLGNLHIESIGVSLYLLHDITALLDVTLYEPRREKTGFLHMRKQRHRSASR